jgi:TonB-dependent SusC/RagA subfamily outer membrane receptor
MQKYIRLFSAFVLFSIEICAQNGRLLDQPMIIKNCHISIEANCALATTNLEIEFFNNRDVEIEGLFKFNLNPNQAITGFELDLNGQYRKGTIEERWKARNAYNTIVGKRVDPALVQMIGKNQYTLNIYPVPANGSRKIKMRIEEVLTLGNQHYKYLFEMLKQHTLQQVNIQIATVGHPMAPVMNQGLIARTTFNKTNNGYQLNDQYNHPVSGSMIAFKIPVPGKTETTCLDVKTNTFSAKFTDTIPETITRSLKRIRVYWDRSGSMSNDDNGLFLKFLTRQIEKFSPEAIHIIPFNHKPGNGKIFTGSNINGWAIRKFIQQTPLTGATNYGALQFNTADDIIFVFTDGKHTWGSRFTEEYKTPVMFITVPYYDQVYRNKYHASDYNYYYNYNYNNTGANFYAINIRLNTADTNYYYPQINQRKIELIGGEDETGAPVNISLVEKINGTRFVKGKLANGGNTITLHFGYGNNILFTRKISIQKNCSDELCERMNTLFQYELINGLPNNWYQSLAFGIDNKIVSWQTAFIVLERIEDYVQYNITPPDDIMQQCLDKGFVKRDYRQQYQYMQKINDAEMLKLVVAEYNKRINAFDKKENEIKIADIAGSFARVEEEKKSAERKELAAADSKDYYATQGGMGNSLSEVVVTAGYSNKSYKYMHGSVSRISAAQITNGVTLTQALQGKVPGVQVINSPGLSDISQIRIRGVGSISQGGNPLLVVDGMPLSFDFTNQLIPSEIDNITIIKSVEATAIYGVRGANGVISVQTKKGRYNGYTANPQKTKLKEAEDEEYIMDMQLTPLESKYNRYLELRAENKSNMAFYLDLAMHFSDAGLSAPIDEMMIEAAEISNNDYSSLAAIAFAYEYMRKFDKAAEIYSDLIKSYPMALKYKYNLGWAFYQAGKTDSAVQLFYKTITGEDYSWNQHNLNIKELMLTDMNMMIALHPNDVDIRYIPVEILKPVTTDLRVLLSSNIENLHSLTVQEGNQEKQSVSRPLIKGRQLTIGNSDYTMAEYQAKQVGNQKIRFNITHYDTWYANQVPPIIRIMTIRNFGKPDQRIQTEFVSLKNQFGEVEIADLKPR